MHELMNFARNSCSAPAGRKYAKRLVAALGLIVSLVSCSSINDLPLTDQSYRDWAVYQTKMSKINSWQIRARAIISIEEAVYQVGISWQREINTFSMVIEAPFGQGVFRIESNGLATGQPPIKLSLPDGQVFYDDSAEALLRKVLGWTIPVKGLKAWIKGLPLDGTDHNFELRVDGRLKSLRQDDWLISYQEYFAPDTAASGFPRKMHLKHANLALKIVIERWHPVQAEIRSPLLFPSFN